MAEEKTVNSSEQSEMLQFLNQNKVAIIIGAVLLLAVILFVTLYLNGSSTTPTSSTAESTQVQVLPSSTRTINQSKPASPTMQVGSEMRSDPFSGPLALRGVIIDPNGKSVAVIEAGNISNVVAKGAKISGNWTVKEIKKDRVILSKDKDVLELQFNGINNAFTEKGGKAE